MRHFETLGLAAKAEESKANELGDSIRKHLKRLYNVDSFGMDDELSAVNL